MLQTYEGNVRAKISLTEDSIKIEWVDLSTNIILWTEHVKPQDDKAFMSQINCVGKFNTCAGHFVDNEGKKHYVMKMETGKLGPPFGK